MEPTTEPSSPSQQSNKFLVPLAIVVAGAMIATAGAVVSAGGVTVGGGGGGGVAPGVDLPVWSNVARPSQRLNAIIVTVWPSRFSALAGTSSRTHWPAVGIGPA